MSGQRAAGLGGVGEGAHLAWVVRVEWKEEPSGPIRSLEGGCWAELRGRRPPDEEHHAERFEWARACARLAGASRDQVSSSSLEFKGDGVEGARGSAHFVCSARSFDLMGEGRARAALAEAVELAMGAMRRLGCQEPLALGASQAQELGRGDYDAAEALARSAWARAEARRIESSTGPGGSSPAPRL